MKIRISLFLTLLAILPAGHGVVAQTTVVTQSIHLRADQSTNHPPLGLLYPPECLQPITPKASGDFYRVPTSQGEDGWAWKPNVNVDIRNEWMRHSRWIDADRDCQHTLHDVLIEESPTAAILNPQRCTVIAGTWPDPFSGEIFTSPSDLGIDHLVPLANAYISGGWPGAATDWRQADGQGSNSS